MTRFTSILAFGFAVGMSGLQPATAQAHQSPSGNAVEIVKAPEPVYPSAAQFFKVIGLCDVHFNLYDYGRSLDVYDVQCSNAVFCLAAKEGVEGADLRVVDAPFTARPGVVLKVVYPLTFYIDDNNEPSPEDYELKSCEAISQS